MNPIISGARADTPGGLWSSKLGGTFEDFTPLANNNADGSGKDFYVTGKADIRELGGFLRVFFKDVQVVKRPILVTSEYKAELMAKYKAERKALGLGDEGEESGDEDQDTEEELQQKKEKEEAILANLIEEDMNKPVKIPPLLIYLTTKKPKVRMVDAEKTGTKLLITMNGVPVQRDEFGVEGEKRSYEAVLRDVDITTLFNYQGIVVMKLPEPGAKVTVEPIMFGMLKLVSARGLLQKTCDALNLTEISQTLEKIKVQIQREAVDLSKSSSSVPEENPANNVKSLSVYRKLADKTWMAFGLTQDAEVDFDVFFKMLDFVDLFMVETQARRIFAACDLQKDGMFGMSEFENFLIAYDALGMANISYDLIVMDVFDALKSVPLETLVDEEIAKANSRPGTSASAEHESDDEDGALAAWKKKEAAAKKKQQDIMGFKTKRSATKPGIDFSSFCEGVQICGVPPERESDPDLLREAFCYAGEVVEKEADTKYLTLNQFRKGWIKIADIPLEFRNRRMKLESGLMGEGRNRDRLNRFIKDAEDSHLIKLAGIIAWVEDLKHERRVKKDQKKRDQAAHRDALMHEANKFFAVRAQEKRLLLKKEQEEKSKKRAEDKILRNKLMLRQQEAQDAKRAEIGESNKKNERLRLQEIVEKGLDKLDMSAHRLKLMPSRLNKTTEDCTKLSYLQLADFSSNKLKTIPDLFLYWMSECRELKLSHNLLTALPDDIELMAGLQILEVSNNRLESPLTMGIGQLGALQRLDLSNNRLDALPDFFHTCAALRYLNVHSNFLIHLPASLGSCFGMEMCNFSGNRIEEIPDEFEYLIALVHLDLSSNKLHHLPHNIGKCRSLKYLNLSLNILSTLPDSFADLEKLEYCNLLDNDISYLPENSTFNKLFALTYFNVRKNKLKVLNLDVGNASNVTFFDASSNLIHSVPEEIGKLVNLQELRLDYNALVALPPEIGNCSMLQTLQLQHNRLKGALPEQIGLLRTLTSLDISFNRIDVLPRSIIGLHELKILKAEHCELSAFPDTTSLLARLESIEVRNNKFTRFPIELHQLKSLRELGLANNGLTLLPRNISVMASLELLDLSRNQLRALPCEFTEILEQVGEVILHTNPWTDMPPRWGRLWPDRSCTDGSATTGNNLSDVVDFLYAVGSFYTTAEHLWQEQAALHCSGRLGYEDFLQALRQRLPHTWDEGVEGYAKYVYFMSRENGVFLRWYESDAFSEEEAAERTLMSNKKRTDGVERSKRDLAVMYSKADRVYGASVVRTDAIPAQMWKSLELKSADSAAPVTEAAATAVPSAWSQHGLIPPLKLVDEAALRREYVLNMNRKMRHLNGLSAEHAKNETEIDGLVFADLRKASALKEVKAVKRSERREKNFVKLKDAETHRLFEILGEDKEGRDAERSKDKGRNIMAAYKPPSTRKHH